MVIQTYTEGFIYFKKAGMFINKAGIQSLLVKSRAISQSLLLHSAVVMLGQSNIIGDIKKKI